jgi:hypothetical protein
MNGYFFSISAGWVGTFGDPLTDCNGNGVEDIDDIANGTSQDCDANLIPDECDYGIVATETYDGIPTTRERMEFETADFPAAVEEPISLRVSAKGAFSNSGAFLFCYLDDTFLGFAFASGGADCAQQAITFDIPLAVWDDAVSDGSRTIEIWASPAVDPGACSSNWVSATVSYLGEFDCDGDGASDLCAIADGLVPDCNGNGIPDSCDIAAGTSADIDSDGVPDECAEDCNGNGLPDAYEIEMGLATDCNDNGIPDSCDVDSGEEGDINGNGIPDSCDLAQGDLNLDGCVDGADLGLLISLWGLPNPPIGDLNGDNMVGGADLGLLLLYWNPCRP